MIEQLKNSIAAKNPALPIYRRLAEELKKLIVSGKFADGSRMPSEAELSEQLNINLRTLRKSLKILSDQGLISQCQGRGTFVTYRQPERWHRFGLFFNAVGSLHDLYSMRMLAALEAAVSRRGQAEIILLRMNKPTTASLLAEINRIHCDGLLVFPSGFEQLLFQQEFDHIPMVFVNIERSIQVPAHRFHVRLADGAIADAVKHLYSLGHRKIAYISCNSDNLSRRNWEFFNSAEELKLDKKFIDICPLQNSMYDAALNSASKMFSADEQPTAVICPGVSFAYGVWQGALVNGKKIPEDISIVGFDVNTHTNPHMSSINQPIDQMADKAVELLFLQQGCGKSLKQHLYDFKAEFEERGSCTAITAKAE